MNSLNTSKQCLKALSAWIKNNVMCICAYVYLYVYVCLSVGVSLYTYGYIMVCFPLIYLF